jgi:glycosyltransferase involved in cell wall biosynthesis
MNYYLELKKLHRRLELEKEVRFLGAVPLRDVLKKYSETDIFILPCIIASDGTRDITPNALIEAMAMKLPVISTTIGGIPEIVEDKISGLLVPPNDETALTDAVIHLVENPELRRQMGENARERVENKFDINKNIQRYIELFSAELNTGRNHNVSSTAVGHS